VPDLRVFIVDGHESFRRAAAEVVDAAVGFRLDGSAASGAEALAAVDADAAVDLLVIDVDLPDADGVAVASALCRRQPGLAVLYTSALRADDLPTELLDRTEHTATLRFVAKAAFDADCLTTIGAGRDPLVYPDADAGPERRTTWRPR
jgi:DNA-binding NarL/FixJ family response regulator